MKELVESRVKRLHFKPPQVRAAQPGELMRQHPLFATLSPDSLLEVEKVSVTRTIPDMSEFSAIFSKQ